VFQTADDPSAKNDVRALTSHHQLRGMLFERRRVDTNQVPQCVRTSDLQDGLLQILWNDCLFHCVRSIFRRREQVPLAPSSKLEWMEAGYYSTLLLIEMCDSASGSQGWCDEGRPIASGAQAVASRRVHLNRAS
jgi:hypothetical protein